MNKVGWEEPSAFRRAMDTKQYGKPPLWPRAVGMLVVMGLMVAGPAMRGRPVGGSWLLTLGLGAGLAAMVAFGIPFITSRGPKLIIFSDKGVNRNGWQGTRMRIEFWPWDRISHFTLETRNLAGRSYQVISLHSAAGGSEPFALNGKVSLQQIETLIMAHGKELRRVS